MPTAELAAAAATTAAAAAMRAAAAAAAIQQFPLRGLPPSDTKATTLAASRYRPTVCLQLPPPLPHLWLLPSQLLLLVVATAGLCKRYASLSALLARAHT